VEEIAHSSLLQTVCECTSPFLINFLFLFKVFQNSSKVVAVHSEDEEILNKNKKLIKNGDVHSHTVWRSEECAISSTRRIVRLAKKYNNKAHVLHITTKQEVDFLSQHKGNITFEIIFYRIP
jgi:dihydroorotase